MFYTLAYFIMFASVDAGLPLMPLLLNVTNPWTTGPWNYVKNYWLSSPLGDWSI
jgi:hypothetical protein